MVVVESRRRAGGKVTQRHVLDLGEIDDSQQRAWEKAITFFDETQVEARRHALLPTVSGLGGKAEGDGSAADAKLGGMALSEGGEVDGAVTEDDPEQGGAQQCEIARAPGGGGPIRRLRAS